MNENFTHYCQLNQKGNLSVNTTFEKVSALNNSFGNPRGDLANPNVEAIRKQALLCLEEAIEMVEAAFPGSTVSVRKDLNDKDHPNVNGVDLVALMDAQGDLTTVNDGVAHVAGFDGNEVYQLVHESNMTKFIALPTDVKPALEYYYGLGFKPQDLILVGDFPEKAIKVAEDIRLNGKFYPKGKFLKNMLTFVEPDFSKLLPSDKS
ncbi:hypothetical protein MIF8_54 [Erwinia phage MIF8]